MGKRRGGGGVWKSGGGVGVGVVDESVAALGTQTWLECIEQYSIIIFFFLIICVGFYYVIHSPGYIQRNLEKYFFLLCLPLILLFFLILSMENKIGFLPAISKVGVYLLVVGVLAWLYTETNTSYWASLTMSWIFIIAIALVPLTFVYAFVVSEMKKWRGWAGFFAQVLFFVPCMMNDAWAGLMREMNLTSVSVYLAILVEVLLIVLYAYMPQISHSVMGTSSDSEALVLLETPIRLKDTYKEISSSSRLFDSMNNTYRANYAISMWIYLNPYAQQVAGYEEETEIFSYGYYSANKNIHYVKPMIRYYGGGKLGETTEERNKFVFYFSQYAPHPPRPTHPDDKPDLDFYEAEMPAQRWNHVVMNYNSNEVHLYINGVMVTTYSLIKQLPTYSPLDKITVGSLKKDSGVHGGICNVIYYKHTLTPEQIALSYNLLKDRDPPLLTLSSATAPSVDRKGSGTIIK